MSRSLRRVLYWIAIVVLAGALLYASLRGIEWQQVWLAMQRAEPGRIALSCGFTTLSLFLRAVRWRLLLQAAVRLPVRMVFWATAAGYFGNNFLPARAGEFLRTLMISRQTGLSKSFVLTTALSERISDAISLVLISSLILSRMRIKPGWFAHAATPFTLLGLAGVLGIALLPKLERRSRGLLLRLPVSQHWLKRLDGVADQIMAAMRTFHDARRLLLFLVLTGVIWFSDAFATILGLEALALPATLPIAFLLITGLALGSALPSTPGYVGIYQFVAVSVLVPFGFTKAEAIAYILLSQAVQYVLIGFWGAWGLLHARAVKRVPDAAKTEGELPGSRGGSLG